MADAVARLKGLGFTILMDDFGSGYSSLNMLKDITVDILKIDMGFLARQDQSQRSESILEAIVSMARFMDLRIIAEGAETKEQVDFLQGIGCDYAQGYYFYRPMSTEALEQLLSQDGIVDYRGVLNPSMELIDVNALLHDDMVSRAAVNNLIGGLAVYAVYADRFELLQVNNEYYHVTGCNSIDLRERQNRISRQVHPDDLPSCKACSPKRTSAPSRELKPPSSVPTERRDHVDAHARLLPAPRARPHHLLRLAGGRDRAETAGRRAARVAGGARIGRRGPASHHSAIGSERVGVRHRFRPTVVPEPLVERHRLPFGRLCGRGGHRQPGRRREQCPAELSRETLWGRPAARTIKVWSNTGEPLTLHIEREIVPDANGKPARVIGYLEDPLNDSRAKLTRSDDNRLLDILKGAAVDHWYINVNTKSFLNSADRRAWRYWAGISLDDWSSSMLEDRLGKYIGPSQDAEAIENFLDFDDMLQRSPTESATTPSSTDSAKTTMNAGWS